MQKLINGIALLSGLVTLSIVGAGAYLYLNKDAMIEQVKEQAGMIFEIESSRPALPSTLQPTLRQKTYEII